MVTLLMGLLGTVGSALAGMVQPLALLFGGRKMGVDAQQAKDLQTDAAQRDKVAQIDRTISASGNDAIRTDLGNKFTKKD